MAIYSNYSNNNTDNFRERIERLRDLEFPDTVPAYRRPKDKRNSEKTRAYVREQMQVKSRVLQEINSKKNDSHI